MSNNPVMWAIRAAVLMMQLLFVAYFVCVQINAIAYLAGKHSAVIGGVKPPAPIGSDTAAIINIVVGLVFEAVVALIVAIVSAIALTSLRDARRLAELRKRRASGVD
jgi:hypothetical protein